MSNRRRHLTKAQQNRKQVAQKLVDVLSELDELLRQEAVEFIFPISESEIHNILVRKLHVGPLPLPCKMRVVDGQASVLVNNDWVMHGYFRSYPRCNRYPPGPAPTVTIKKDGYNVIINRNGLGSFIERNLFKTEFKSREIDGSGNEIAFNG